MEEEEEEEEEESKQWLVTYTTTRHHPEVREKEREGEGRNPLFFPSLSSFFPLSPGPWNPSLSLRMQNYAVVINRGCYAWVGASRANSHVYFHCSVPQGHIHIPLLFFPATYLLLLLPVLFPPLPPPSSSPGADGRYAPLSPSLASC